MIKNQTVRLNITDITAEGAGVGKYEGMAVFVTGTAPGDVIDARIVKVNRSYAYGIIDKIITGSDARITVDCPYFHKCGGCVFRHINYKSELILKENRVRETLRRIAGADVKSGGIIGSDNTFAYRNKAQFPFALSGEAGFFAPRSHRVIPVKDCPLLPDEFNAAAKCVSDFVTEKGISVYNEATGEGLVRHLYLRAGAVSGETMVTVVLNGDTLPFADTLISRLKSLLGDNLKSVQININKKSTNVILGDKNKVIYGTPFITDTLCGVTIRLSPFTFYQVNHGIAEKLYCKIKEYAAPGGKNIIDLYCGAGSIGLSLAKTAKSVIGVEIVRQAIDDAKQNAVINGINNAEFICGDAKAAAKALAARGVRADVVIVDPPRKGCESELLNTVAKDFSPERIVYVSCDPATLARDIKILNGLGYKPEEFTAFDMFPRTGHVETVCKLIRIDINP